MDGKVEIVRAVLNDQTKSKLVDLNRVDEFGKSLIHRVNCRFRIYFIRGLKTAL